MNLAQISTANRVITVIGTIFAGRAALRRIKQAYSDKDRLELLDATLEVAVVITGLLVILRRLRRGQEES